MWILPSSSISKQNTLVFDVNILRGSVETLLKYDGIFSDEIIANVLENVPAKELENQ